ncbi:MAG TPA: UDP-2,3-diacylglucosamine diphosphatase [Nannocystaceae bacterium]|nr:UDP-2,3-diacylglucosamine diphosphatase [Nannocystaceae bacterium]
MTGFAVRVAAISDLHIGAPAGRDGFGHAISDFAAWLDRLERDHDRIVLLGDVFQTDHTIVPGARRRASQLHAARQRAGVLAQRFTDDRYHYVHGNHDAIAKRELATPTELRLAADGVDLLFTHGHQFDPVARGAQWLADLGTWTTGALRRTPLLALARWLEAHDVAIKHARFGGRDGPYARGAAELGTRAHAQVVIMGHTHAAELHELGDVLYANTGTCSGGRRECVSIDTGARTVALLHWPQGERDPICRARAAIG